MSDLPRHLQDDGRVHAVAVACTRGDGRWLLIRRSRHVRAPLAVAFPGGAVEAGETQREAVVREMREELALEVEPLACFWSHVFDDRPLVLWGWHARLGEGAPSPDPLEVDEVLWLTSSEATVHPDRTPQMESFLAALEAHLGGRRGTG